MTDDETGTLAGQLTQTAAQHEWTWRLGLPSCTCGGWMGEVDTESAQIHAFADHRLDALLPVIDQQTAELRAMLRRADEDARLNYQRAEHAEAERDHYRQMVEDNSVAIDKLIHERERALGETWLVKRRLVAIHKPRLLPLGHPTVCEECRKSWPCSTVQALGDSGNEPAFDPRNEYQSYEESIDDGSGPGGGKQR